jgi:hypothetical protein
MCRNSCCATSTFWACFVGSCSGRLCCRGTSLTGGSSGGMHSSRKIPSAVVAPSSPHLPLLVGCACRWQSRYKEARVKKIKEGLPARFQSFAADFNGASRIPQGTGTPYRYLDHPSDYPGSGIVHEGRLTAEMARELGFLDGHVQGREASTDEILFGVSDRADRPTLYSRFPFSLPSFFPSFLPSSFHSFRACLEG